MRGDAHFTRTEKIGLAAIGVAFVVAIAWASRAQAEPNVRTDAFGSCVGVGWALAMNETAYNGPRSAWDHPGSSGWNRLWSVPTLGAARVVGGLLLGTAQGVYQTVAAIGGPFVGFQCPPPIPWILNPRHSFTRSTVPSCVWHLGGIYGGGHRNVAWNLEGVPCVDETTGQEYSNAPGDRYAPAPGEIRWGYQYPPRSP